MKDTMGVQYQMLIGAAKFLLLPDEGKRVAALWEKTMLESSNKETVHPRDCPLITFIDRHGSLIKVNPFYITAMFVDEAQTRASALAWHKKVTEQYRVHEDWEDDSVDD